jgi:hypothetical protein
MANWTMDSDRPIEFVGDSVIGRDDVAEGPYRILRYRASEDRVPPRRPSDNRRLSADVITIDEDAEGRLSFDHLERELR